MRVADSAVDCGVVDYVRRVAEAIRQADPRITWVGGLAETWAPPLYAVGARGFTSGLIRLMSGFEGAGSRTGRGLPLPAGGA